MGYSKTIQECEDCQRLLEKHERKDLNMCEYCGHIFLEVDSKGKILQCTCGGDERDE